MSSITERLRRRHSHVDYIRRDQDKVVEESIGMLSTIIEKRGQHTLYNFQKHQEEIVQKAREANEKV